MSERAMTETPAPTNAVSVEQIHEAATSYWYQWLWIRIRRARLRIGSYIIGDEIFAVYAALWIVRTRALAAVSADGRVTLAACEPLAEALYKQLPGRWSLTMTRIDDDPPVAVPLPCSESTDANG